MNDRLSRQGSGQSAASRLADVLQRVTRQQPGDFTGVGLDEESNVVISPDLCWVQHQLAMEVLPRCFAVEDGYPVDEDCAMPDAICHRCAKEGRRLVDVQWTDG
ncbi:hypothetical protein GCM10009609_43840 [Pseudonocardia aurantiaca]